MGSSTKYLIAVAGPTASGKTSTSIQLAQEFNTEILSCDSRQLYREMNIGTAKPSVEELNQVKHHFINSQSISEDYDAGNFEKDANHILAQLFENKDIAIMTGGTGLFLKSAIHGLDPLPGKNEEIRSKWQKILEQKGIEALQDHLKVLDPQKWESMDRFNPQRVIRAIEICEQSGSTHAQLQSANAKPRPYKVILIALDIPREELYARIDARVDQMLEEGLIDEVRSLQEYQHLNALKTVGYTEIFQALNGECSLDEAIEKVKQHSRNYAKRQITWFKKMGAHWMSPYNYPSILNYIKSQMD